MVFGFAFALSAMLWLGVGIYWIENFFFSLAGLGLIVIPVALVASLMPLAFPGSQILATPRSRCSNCTSSSPTWPTACSRWRHSTRS